VRKCRWDDATCQWLNRNASSPLNGLRNIAADLVEEWGYNPAEHPGLMDALEMACWEAFSDTAREVMREHGLTSPDDQPVSAQKADC
jgi:hypothetical protein